MKIEINIDDYISESEKKEIAIETFKQSILDGLTKREGEKLKNVENYERVISNSVHRYLQGEIDSILDCDTNELIRSNVDRLLRQKDFTHSLFRVANAWEKEDSPAQKISNAAVESYREEMTAKIHTKLAETIDDVGLDTVYELFNDIFQDFLSDRLTNDKQR